MILREGNYIDPYVVATATVLDTVFMAVQSLAVSFLLIKTRFHTDHANTFFLSLSLFVSILEVIKWYAHADQTYFTMISLTASIIIWFLLYNYILKLRNLRIKCSISNSSKKRKTKQNRFLDISLYAFLTFYAFLVLIYQYNEELF